ncbi:MAG: hypothetical protein R3C14_33605 [Caldilineaceae bacterium]
MNNQHSFSIWLTFAVIVVGLGSLFLLGAQPGAMVTLAEQVATVQEQEGVAAGQALAATATALPALLELANAVPAPTATPSPTPVPPLVLPNVPVPEGGQVYLLTPNRAEAVGWAKAGDEAPNHFGDYNIYAGVYEGRQHIGAIQFDLSSIPPGSPILYADLTLTGLANDWLGLEGEWQAQLLQSWMDQDWNTRNFHWLARVDSGALLLEPTLPATELQIGRQNTLSLPPAGLTLLEARLFTGRVSFRLFGPASGDDNLFAWDSGFGIRTIGRGPVLRIVTGGPAPAVAPLSPTPDYVVITLTPTDANALLAQAAQRLTATAEAPPNTAGVTPEPTVTPTPFPPNWVTPVIMVNTPVPENGATAVWQAQVATAQAIVNGTPTATPPNVWTATSTPLPPPPTPTPLIVAYELLTPTSTPSVTPEALPDLLRGKLLFYSDRNGGKDLMVMDPDGSNVALWTGGAPGWIYAQATRFEAVAPGGRYQVVVSSEQISNLQLWALDLVAGTRQQLTYFKAIAYDPVWSPAGNPIAFVSADPGNDEIFTVNADGSGLTRLTNNQWEWDKHPSWSPDGNQLVFWSNRETQRKQIWIMNADGSNPRNLSNNEYNDWDPVWVK